MIRGYVALIRTLRAFMEESGLPWGSVHFVTERDDDNRPIWDDSRIEISFTHRDDHIGISIWAPAEKPIPKIGSIPNGRIAVRSSRGVISGPIDQSTWNDIINFISEEGQ